MNQIPNIEETAKEFVTRYHDFTDNKIHDDMERHLTELLHQQLQKAREEEREDAYAHCAIIREREINDILFEVADEARDTFGNGEKIIREWMQKNNCEIHPLLIEDDHSELDQDEPFRPR